MKHLEDRVQCGGAPGMEERIPKRLEPSEVGSYYEDCPAKVIL